MNPARPRRGSFEVTLLRADGSSECGPGAGAGQRGPPDRRLPVASGNGCRVPEPLRFTWPFFPGAELWTGLKKGPPRKLKFPEPHVVLEELKKYLS